MTVKIARNGDVELAYETFGEEGGEPLLLIMGLGHQMLLWPDAFCEALAAAGFHVARFDNRDSGLSTSFGGPHDSAGQQKWWQALFGQGAPPYSAVAYVEDAMAVMDDARLELRARRRRLDGQRDLPDAGRPAPAAGAQPDRPA